MPSPEDKARGNIDQLLTKAGWTVRDQSHANILAHRGLAIRNFTLKPGHGHESKGESVNSFIFSFPFER
jgi:type I restriction enzyme R subunit